MKIGIIVQARLGSKRLPSKVLMDIGGRPMIWHVLKRMAELKLPLIVATPEGEGDQISRGFPRGYDVGLSEGPEDDVLARYYQAAQGYDAIVRVTGDCPLIDPEACRRVIDAFSLGLFDYVANDIRPSYPIGLGCEVFSFAALELAHQTIGLESLSKLEHVRIRPDKRFTELNLRCPINGLSDLKLSVDTQEDLDFVRAIDLAGPKDYSLQSTREAIDRVKAKDHA